MSEDVKFWVLVGLVLLMMYWVWWVTQEYNALYDRTADCVSIAYNNVNVSWLQ